TGWERLRRRLPPKTGQQVSFGSAAAVVVAVVVVSGRDGAVSVCTEIPWRLVTSPPEGWLSRRRKKAAAAPATIRTTARTAAMRIFLRIEDSPRATASQYATAACRRGPLVESAGLGLRSRVPAPAAHRRARGRPRGRFRALRALDSLPVVAPLAGDRDRRGDRLPR